MKSADAFGIALRRKVRWNVVGQRNSVVGHRAGEECEPDGAGELYNGGS